MSGRQTQPYRAGGSRGPSPVLTTMRAGRSLGRTEAISAMMRGGAPKMGSRGVQVPRVKPPHKR